MRREACLKFNRNQVFRQRMCCGLKTEPAQWWRVDVQDGTGAGGAQCRARTLAPAHTGSALCLVCLGDLECARFIASRASAILASSSMAARPNATESGSLYHYSAHRAFTPSTPGAAITLLPVLGTKFSIPVLKDFEDELYCQEWISLYFCQKFINRAFQQSLASISSSI